MAYQKEHAASRFIEDVLERKIGEAVRIGTDSDRKKWMFLLSSATGSGKSHAVASVMGKFASSDKHDVRFIYIIHTRDNRDEIRKKLEELFPGTEDEILVLKSEAEMIVDYFARGKEPDLSELGTLPSYVRLERFIKDTVLASSNRAEAITFNQETIDSYTRGLKQDLRRNYFRIRKEKGKSAAESFRKEISVIFPTADLKKFKVIITTTHRFMYPVWTPALSQKLYDMDLFRNQFLVIDEIDAQKSTMLKILSEAAAKEVIDQTMLFSSIHHVLKNSEFLPKYGVSPEDAKNITDFFDEVYRKYYDGYHFLYEGGEDPGSRYILRSEISSIVEGKAQRLGIRIDREKMTSYVYPLDSDSPKESLMFSGLIRDIDRALSRLMAMGAASVKAMIYRAREKAKEENKWIDTDELRRNRIDDFIRDLGYSPEDDEKKYTFLKEGIEHFQRMAKKERKRVLASNAQDFYPKGFSVVEVRSPDEGIGYERFRSGFRFFSLLDTPEYILQSVASRMYIVGVSATSTLETVTRNFDLKYLRSAGIPVQRLSAGELEKLNRLYIEDNRQEHRSFNVAFTDVEEMDLENVCEKYFAGDETCLLLLKRIEQKWKSTKNRWNSDSGYVFKRYLKYIAAYYDFLTRPEITSYLAFVNQLPGSASGMQEELHILFEKMILANRDNPEMKEDFRGWIDRERNRLAEEAKEKLFFVARAKNMDEYREVIEKGLLRKGGHAFVFTSYPTMGSGKNIHYEVEEPEDIRGYEGENRRSRKRDFSAIYCELPTHIVPLPDFETDGPPGKRYAPILQTIYYIHALYASRMMSWSDFYVSLENIIGGKRIIKYDRQSTDYINAVMGMVIQAVGRLHRENNPDDPMTILIDEQILPLAVNFDPEDIAALPSIRRLLEVAGTEEKERTKGNGETKKIIERDSARLARKIRNLLANIRKDRYYREEWESIRKELLVHPAVADGDSSEFAALYTPELDTDRYWYRTDDDFETVDVILRDPRSNRRSEVSAEAAGLDIIGNIPELRAFFEEKGYALDFKHRCLPLPAAFNNFYKGILGETVGRYVFEKICGIDLREMEDGAGYEFFDFVSSGGIYVDFKHYSTHTLESTAEREVREKAAAKLRDLGGRRGVVANVLLRSGGPANASREISYADGIYIVPFLIDATDPESPEFDAAILKKIKEVFFAAYE